VTVRIVGQEPMKLAPILNVINPTLSGVLIRAPRGGARHRPARRERGVDGHRADIVTLKAAKTLCAYEGRTAVEPADIDRTAKMALPHRLRRQPFDSASPFGLRGENQAAL
jgi:Mg-chelatase subunit ChlI